MKDNSNSPISGLEDHLGFWLRFVSNQVSGRFERQLAERAVSLSEWVVLRVLYERPETTHAALIDALGMTKGAASKIVARLVDKGYVLKGLAQDRLREQVLSLTSAGLALVPQLAGLADENDAHFFAHLPDAERQSLLGQLQALVSHHQLKEIPTL